MTRKQKAEAVEAIASKLQETPTIYLTNYSGLSVAEMNELRGKFRAANVEYRVLKNTLVRKAMESLGGYEALYDQLNDPTAVAFTEEPAAPARVMKDFLEDNKKEIPALKGAFVDGAFYGADALEILSKLKSKDEILGDILGLLMAPMTNVVGALQGQGSTLVGAIKQIAEREED
ncbi:MAG: 50S ribosomal protein L10 [Bacteroidota bacterium]